MEPPAAMDAISSLYADQPVLHYGRRATFLHLSKGAAIIRYWGDSHAVSVPIETLSLFPASRAAGPGRPPAARDEPMARERAARDAPR